MLLLLLDGTAWPPSAKRFASNGKIALLLRLCYDFVAGDANYTKYPRSSMHACPYSYCRSIPRDNDNKVRC